MSTNEAVTVANSHARKANLGWIVSSVLFWGWLFGGIAWGGDMKVWFAIYTVFFAASLVFMSYKSIAEVRAHQLAQQSA